MYGCIQSALCHIYQTQKYESDFVYKIYGKCMFPEFETELFKNCCHNATKKLIKDISVQNIQI